MEFRQKADIDSSPAVANGIVYIGSFNGKVYAIGNETLLPPFANFTADVKSRTTSANGYFRRDHYRFAYFWN